MRKINEIMTDPTAWDRFDFRDDDVVIATPGKSGTTWMQQIVSQLIFRGQEGIDVAKISPWIDRKGPKMDENLETVRRQEHRRFVKTHLPADILAMSDRAKYICVVRDGRDVAWSWPRPSRTRSPKP